MSVIPVARYKYDGDGGAAPQPTSASVLLQLALSATMQGIVEHDLVRGTSTYSERWQAMLGFQGEFRLPPNPELWQTLTHPEDLPDVLDDWQAHLEFSWPFQRTWRMQHREGGYRWIECHSVVHTDERGEPVKALSLFADVTERVEAAARHVALLDAIPDTIVRVDQAGVVLDLRIPAGTGTSELFRSADGDNAVPQCAGDFGERLADCARRAVASNTLQTFEYPLRREQSIKHFEVRCAPSGEGQVVCLIRDVTEKKQLESQLLQAQKLESIGQLAAGIAHEINTPLQFIGDNVRFAQTASERILSLVEAYRQVVQDSANEERRKELAKLERRLKFTFLSEQSPSALKACVEGVERVAEIVMAMKEFSHPGTKKPAPSDLNRAIQSTVTVSRNEWKDIAEVTLDLQADMPPVRCVVGEINQCVLNIIVNACHAIADKYGADKQGRIELATSRTEEEAILRITDNGPGIPEAVKERIFDPFFTTKEVGKGTGQGLAMARSLIVDRHGGQLRCETRVGEGTTFEIRLPLHVPELSEEGEDPASARAGIE